MKKIFYLLILLGSFLGSFTHLFSQDVIYTKNKEIINCKIARIDSRKIYFSYAEKGVLTKENILRDSVSHYEYNYFFDEQAQATLSLLKKPNNFPLLLSFDLGFGYNFIDVPEEISANSIKMYNNTRPGFDWGFDIGYFLSNQWGFGVKYQQFNTWDSFTWDSTGENVGNNTHTVFLGASVLWRLGAGNQNQNFFRCGVSLGWIGHYETYLPPGIEYTINGGGLGYVLEAGYDIRVSKSIGLGFSLSYTGGIIEGVVPSANQSINNNEVPTIYLGRMNATIGIRFYQ